MQRTLFGDERVFQPRYVAYAASQSRSAAEQLEHDRDEWGGAAMCPFILWIKEMRGLFWKARPECVAAGKILDQQAFSEFIGE